MARQKVNNTHPGLAYYKDHDVTVKEAEAWGCELLAPDEGLPKGVVAEELSLDVPFTLQLAPTVSGPGGVFSVWANGALSGSWTCNVEANIDREIDGTWRTLWIITDNDHPSDPLRVEDPASGHWAAVVGVTLDRQLLFSVPDDVPVGIYRICRHYVRSTPRDQRAYVCAPLTIEG